jgi:hypothetical protein
MAGRSQEKISNPFRETDPFPKDEQHYQRMGLF